MSLSSEDFEKSKRAFDDLKSSMNQARKIQDDMNKGLGKYAETLKNIAEQQKNINHIESELAKTAAKVNVLKDKLEKEEEKRRKKITAWQKLYETGSEKTKKIAEKNLKTLISQTDELREQLAVQEGILENGKQNLKIQKQNLEVTKQAAKDANKLLATWNSISKLPGLGKKWGFDKMKSWGVFEMDKEIRNAARSMNVGSKDFEGFRKNISRAADSTVVWGVNAKELAKIQQGYSEAIGRSVELTEEGYKAMALMAEGTGLGAEFAVQMATEMDKFGANAKTSKDLVAGTVKQAGKLGVNGAAASKKLVSLLKLSQTYVFKGGQEGLKKMASDAERLKLDLEGAAGFAEKVMRPEGAVETAALLTTMGGEFAKLGDPFQLMFKARNDFAGFAKDLGKASSEFVEFNKQTGAFDIKGGLARDRMLEISKITGVQMDKLQEMAVAEKKLQMIQGNIPAGITSEEDKKLIASLTEVGKGGKLMIKLRGKDPLNIDQLTPKMLEKYKRDQNTLEKSAEQARTFEEVVEDLITSFKQTLLPFAQGLKDGLGKPLQELMKDWKENGLYEKLRGFSEAAGKIAGFIGDFITKFPELSAALYLLFGPAKWLANGYLLGKGFMSVAGGVSGGNNMFNQSKISNNKSFGSRFSSADISPGVKGVSLLAGLTSGISEYSEQKEKGSKDAGIKAINKGLLTTLGTAGGMALGAALAPATGGLSLLIPALVGGLGTMAGDMAGEALIADDALIARNGKNNGGPGTRIQFNPHDKFMSFDDVMIAGTNAGANGKLAEEIRGKSDKTNKTDVSGKLTHDVKISVGPNNDFTNTVINAIMSNPKTLSDLRRELNKTGESERNGGKKGPKPKGIFK